jgi:hypothetical protein
MARKTIKPGSTVEVYFTPREREIVIDETVAGPNLTERLRLAALQGRKLVVRYTLDDVDELVGFVAAAANHTDDELLQEECCALFEQLMAALESYDDGGWQQGR